MAGRLRILFADDHEIFRAVRGCRVAISELLFFVLVASCSSSLCAPALTDEDSISTAYKFTVNSWTSEDHLPGNAVSALAPSRDGYLWIGSPNGLARFDGVRFVRFHASDGLTSLEIRQLLADRAGRLWLGTPDAGLMLYQHGRFRAFAGTNGFIGERVRVIAEDAEGRVWIAHTQGLARWDDDHLVDMQLPYNGPKQMGCYSVCCGSNGVWALGEEWSLQEWRKGTWQPGPKLRKTGFRFDKIFQTRNGQLWSQIYPYGLARLEGDKWRLFGPESALPKNYITSVLDQGEEGLICGSSDQGLFLFHDERASPIALNQGPEKDGILSLQQDNVGNVWVGTSSQGLLRLRKPRVQIVPGSERARLARMAFDNHGRFWIASSADLWFEQGGKLIQAPRAAGMQSIRIAMLRPCPAGGVWICISGMGLWEYDPDRHESPIQRIKGNPDDLMGVLLADDAAGGAWFGTETGAIGRLTGQSTNFLGQLKREASHRVVSFLEDSSDGVWARIEGTAMVRLNAQGEEIERVGTAQGLPVNAIRCWIGDGEGGLWMGSPMGLYWWHKSKLTLFDERHGLPEEALANLVDDASGDLWCAANAGLFRLRKKELEAVAAQKASVLHPLVMGRSSGLTSMSFVTGIAARAVRGPNGRLYFPRAWDVVSFNPADFEKAEPAPKVLIEEVFADGHKLESPTSTGKSLRIAARTGEIAVRYTALECVAPETAQFRHRFEGLDENWSEVGGQRVANFRHLAPGTYRFRVSASAAGGDWAEPGAMISWIVEPFFWQTGWFRALGFVVAIGIVTAFGWKRVRTVEKRRAAQELFSRRLLDSQEAERRRIAGELHDSLGQNLVLVKNLATMAQQQGNGGPLPEISAAVAQALDEVHTISYALRPPELDRLGLAKAIAGMVRRAEEASGIRFTTHLELDGALPAGMDIQLFRIAQEAVGNLMKHSGAKSARMEMWRDEAGAHLVVADDGRGFDTSADGNAGLGLTGISERVRLLGGRHELSSTPGKGTTLSVLVPCASDS